MFCHACLCLCLFSFSIFFHFTYALQMTVSIDSFYPLWSLDDNAIESKYTVLLIYICSVYAGHLSLQAEASFGLQWPQCEPFLDVLQ